jgi:arylsulfatase A-like enzyme
MNLLVLCTDTFRADYLGCYGNSWVATPALDQLAAQGVRFADFYGEGLPTLPARRVLYTGRRIFPLTGIARTTMGWSCSGRPASSRSAARRSSRGSSRTLPANAPTWTSGVVIC